MLYVVRCVVRAEWFHEVVQRQQPQRCHLSDSHKDTHHSPHPTPPPLSAISSHPNSPFPAPPPLNPTQERDEAEAAARRVEEEHDSRAPPGREVDEEGHPILTQEEVEAFVTLKGAWGHKWEEEQRTRAPEEYCAEREVQLGLKIFYLVRWGRDGGMGEGGE